MEFSSVRAKLAREEGGLKTHQLDSSEVHYLWNNALPPRLMVQSGDTVVVETRNGDDDYFSPNSTSQDVALRSPMVGHALTGPIHVDGARPGDALQVDVLAVQPSSWGYTFITHDSGLLLESEFRVPYFKLWDLSDARTAELKPGVRIPLDPFLGIMGTATAMSGSSDTRPPTRNGGNMDARHLTAGSTVWLPVDVAGAMLSVGDAHGAQGDGEVCGTAIETGAVATLRLTVVSGYYLSAPQFRTAAISALTDLGGPCYGAMGIGPDPIEATRDAVRELTKYLVRSWSLSQEEAYVLCSVAAHLELTEVVNRPNWVVSASIPLNIFSS